MKAKVLTAAQIKKLIPKRRRTSHKGDNGHLLIVAGSRGMTGAAYLCALGALKAGSGLVTVAGPEPVRRIIVSRLPEAMTLPLPDTSDGYLTATAVRAIRKHVRRRTITTLAAGPGLTVHHSVRQIILSLVRLGLPLVLDADGLNNITPSDIKKKSVSAS